MKRPLRFIVWLVVCVVTYVVVSFLDRLQGLGGDVMQAITREIIAPGVGGYVAIAFTTAWLARANIAVVFWCFAVSIAVLTFGSAIVMVAFFTQASDFSWSDQLFAVVSGAITIGGAAFARRHAAE